MYVNECNLTLGEGIPDSGAADSLCCPAAYGAPRPGMGQGSDPSCSWDLSCSCGNARSLTHCARLGTEPASQRFQDAADSHYAAAGTPEFLCFMSIFIFGLAVPL